MDIPLKYKRILLKFSGEVLRDGKTGDCISPDIVMAMASRVSSAVQMGCEVAIVIGGGNIFRGATGALSGIDRSSGDYMGMLATTINAMALQCGLEKIGLQTRVMTAIDMPRVAEPMILRRALRHLDKGRVVIFAAGTGNPYFSTDTGAALRASEIHADALLKATKVDGVYTSDPKKNPDAKRYSTLSYRTAFDRQLKVMDSTAFAMCMDNKIPIVVFDFFDEGALERVITGQEGAGTLVADVEDRV